MNKTMSLVELGSWVTKALMVAVLLSGCNRSAPKPDTITRDDRKAGENTLTFDNLSLEQADEQGKTLWQLKAKQVTYSRDRKLAQVKEPNGELFQAGKPIYTVKAQLGEVQQDGKTIVLKGNVVATDRRQGLILTGQELQWQPRNHLLLVRQGLTGTHKQLKVSAQEARANTQTETVVLSGQVVAIAPEQEIQFRSDIIQWDIPQQQIKSDRTVEVQRQRGTNQFDRATAEGLAVDLAQKTATLLANTHLSLTNPSVSITTESLIWDFANQQAIANQSLQIFYPQEQLSFSSDRGQLNLQAKVLNLNGQVRGKSQQRQSQLSADQITWNLETKAVQAIGNVVYSQTDPALRVTGARAQGNLDQETVVVSGGDVVTQVLSIDALNGQ